MNVWIFFNLQEKGGNLLPFKQYKTVFTSVGIILLASLVGSLLCRSILGFGGGGSTWKAPFLLKLTTGVCVCVCGVGWGHTGNMNESLKWSLPGLQGHPHVMKGGCCPEAALCSPGQPVPRVLGQVAVHLLTLLLLILSILQSVQTHEGQLSEERDRCKRWANSDTHASHHTLSPWSRLTSDWEMSLVLKFPASFIVL